MRSTQEYLRDLKKWLRDTSDSPLEEMSDFFAGRLDGYEEHMAIWEKSYQRFAELLPSECQEILDLGCGTGLELDEIWKKNPYITVTGVDLCQSMLDELLKKHSDKRLTTVCRDYFQYDFGKDKWDAVISFESLHHFLPQRKKELYQKAYNSLKNDGIFILGDYIACCNEEEELLRGVYTERRKQSAIPEHCFVHFDIPLTLEHELELLKEVGFQIEKVLDDPEEVTIITARKSNEPEIIKLRDHYELAGAAADWFHQKWGIPVEAYKESISDCLTNRESIPQWYVVLKGNMIIGGLGVIENDFHNRKDLTPNVCAVYVEEQYRCQGIAGKMLNFVCEDMKEQGIDTLYLITDHTSFYERYGWKFLCMVQGDGEPDMSRMYVH